MILKIDCDFVTELNVKCEGITFSRTCCCPIRQLLFLLKGMWIDIIHIIGQKQILVDMMSCHGRRMFGVKWIHHRSSFSKWGYTYRHDFQRVSATKIAWTFRECLIKGRKMWFQWDKMPAHYDYRIRNTLNQMFPERWIGRSGPIIWPARSLDLTPLDFFLQGYLKISYIAKDRMILMSWKRELQQPVKASVILLNVLRSFKYHITFCIHCQERQFKHISQGR